MLPSWRSLLSWKPIKMEGRRRAADGLKPVEIIDLTDMEVRAEITNLIDGNGKVYKCPICMESPEEQVATMCGHVFCKSCLSTALSPCEVCPLCKKIVSGFIRIYT
ncbi:E3 ubiquitin-protein ligase COP1 [Drosophila rhopaloa]|uniref:E3 ubiquitin-protein ligase RFWD2 n=1 Tax=Drosophila rhopaloa TaxID=1041015 RepID=A0A6P4E2B0_DRORH|nr:E3 ubiquitin-protein ligase COP1 [Drosophila rhopaloa]